MNTGKVLLAFLVLGMAWVLLVPGITYGFNLEYEIICPPSDGATWSGKFSDEPLKKNLNTGRITRIRGPVKRAIAKLACENVSIPECGDEICSSASGENALTCETDCQSVCGDGACTHSEDASSCPDDCQVACEDDSQCSGMSGQTGRCCAGFCADIATDRNNCDVCGYQCAVGQICVVGNCQ